MKALLLEEYKRLVYTDFPEPQVGKDEVLIQVKACGICGSDIHGYDGSSGRRIPPLVMGHEAAGIITAVGADVSGWTPGERVTFDSTDYCGRCYYCRRGQVNLCDNRRVLGVSTGEYRRHGAFAEYVAVPERILYRLPENVSFPQATVVEPLAIAVHAVDLTPRRVDDSIVVVGAGMVGLVVIQVLRNAGCGQIIAVDLEQSRLDLACQLGADVGWLANRPDLTAMIQDKTEGRGADCVFEVVGNTPALNTAIKSVRKGGSVTLVGNLSSTVDFPLQAVVTREITLYGSCASSGEYPVCLDLVSHQKVNLDILISATAPLSDGSVWFDRLYRREAGLMKVILEP
jgi:L-iditol 2-dehydrogenase